MELSNELAEQIVLGTALENNSLAHELSSFSAEFFSTEEHKRIHTGLIRNIKDYGATSKEYLVANGVSQTTLRTVIEKSADNTTAKNLIPTLANLASLRTLKKSCEKILWEITSKDPVLFNNQEPPRKKNSAELLTELVEEISKLNVTSSHVTKTYEELIQLVKTNPEPDRHPTPWPQLNLCLQGGIESSSYVMLFAEANVGKTLLLCQLSGFLAGLGHRIVFFSLEQPYMAIGRRLFAQYEDSLEEKSRNIKVVTNCDTIEEITARMAIEASGSPEVIFCVDHLQNIRSTRADPGGTAYIEGISKDIVRAVRRTGCTTFVVSEVNRREGSGLFRIRDSGAIEHDIDIGMFLDQSLTPDQVKLIICKNRNGPKGTIFLSLDRKTLLFGDA